MIRSTLFLIWTIVALILSFILGMEAQKSLLSGQAHPFVSISTRQTQIEITRSSPDITVWVDGVRQK